MSEYHWLLGVHLTGAFLFVAGGVVAGMLQLAAIRRERPSEVLLLLRTARAGVLLVALGALLTLAFGLWLAHHLGYGVGDEWVVASICLWALSMALGGAGGRTARHARYLAERLTAEGDRPSPELAALVGDRTSLWLSYAGSAAIVAMLALMVWKPGAG